jgi:hypothetical protein
MKVSYTLNSRDYFRTFRYLYRTVPKLRYARRNAYIVGVISSLIAYMVKKYPFSFEALIPMGFTLVANYYLLMLWDACQSYWQYRSVEKELLSMSMEITEDRVTYCYGKFSKQMDWSQVLRIGQDKSHIYIFFEEGKAHVVPKRAFSSPKELRDFWNTLDSIWQHSRGVKLAA